MKSDDELSAFIGASFPSVWTLELLLLLKREPHPWPQADLVAALRASELIVRQALESLVAAGLVGVSNEGAQYLPVSDGVAKLVEEAESLYAMKPNQVRRVIVTASAGGIAAFADAFRLRKD